MSIAIEYRTPPKYLSVTSIVAELLWIDDATTWHGCVGEWARTRRAALRVELRRREWTVTL